MKYSAQQELPDEQKSSGDMVVYYNSSESPATRAFVNQLDKALSVTHNMFVAPAKPITIRTAFNSASADTGTVQS